MMTSLTNKNYPSKFW